MWKVHLKDGSPLSVDRKLRGEIQPQVLSTVSVLWLGRHVVNKISILLITTVVLVDYMQESPLTYKLSEGKRHLLYAGVFSAAMIGIAVIFLFGVQIYMLSKNMTTIESFVNGMSTRVHLWLLSNPSRRQLSARIWRR